MQKRSVRYTVRLDPKLQAQIEHVAKTRGFSSASAYIRAALERDISGPEAALDSAELRLSATLDRLHKSIHRFSNGQQVLIAMVDGLVKILLTAIPEPPAAEQAQAVSRGKLRHQRYLKSVGLSMRTEALALVDGLVDHVEE
jgi:Arc/MetJ-type ribon-helix-helix transcriptional regulator